MSYKNIDVSKLKSSLNDIDNINYKKISDLNSKLINEQWQSPIRVRIKTALNEAIEEYKNIQEKIKNYKSVAALIETYQNLDNDYDRFSKKVTEYRKIYNNYCNKTNLDFNDEYWKEYYYNKYIEYSNKLSQTKNSKNELDNKINNLMN